MNKAVNKFTIVISLALVFSSLSPPAYAKEVAGCRLYYVVKSGDTLSRMASAMGMVPYKKSAVKIAKANDIEDENLVEIGDKICVDENIIKTGSEALDCYKTDKKKKICLDKDSLSTILSKDISINDRSYKGSAKKCSSMHTIKKGESLSMIARSLDIGPPYQSALILAEVSGIKNPGKVEIGDKVCVDKKFLKSINSRSKSELRCFKTTKNRKICIDDDTLRSLESNTLKGKNSEAEKRIVAEEVIKAEIKAGLENKIKTEKEKTEVETEQNIVVDKPIEKIKTEKQPEVLEKTVIKPETESKVEPTDKNDQDAITGISVSSFLNYSRIDAAGIYNGARGSVLSKPDYGAEFKIMQIWGNYFTSEIMVSAERRLYVTNSGRSFLQRGGELFNFGAGMGFRPFRKIELKLRVLYGDELYFRAPDTTSLAIDNTRALKFDVAMYYDIISSKYAATGFGGGLRLVQGSYVDAIGGAGYNTRLGYGYFGTFYMKQNFKHIRFEESFSYESIQKDSDLFKQIHMAAYFKIAGILTF